MLEEQPPGDVMGKGRDDNGKPERVEVPNPPPPKQPPGVIVGPSGGPGNSD